LVLVAERRAGAGLSRVGWRGRGRSRSEEEEEEDGAGGRGWDGCAAREDGGGSVDDWGASDWSGNGRGGGGPGGVVGVGAGDAAGAGRQGVRAAHPGGVRGGPGWREARAHGRVQAVGVVQAAGARRGCACGRHHPGDSVAEAVIAGGLFNFFNLYNNLLLVRIVLTWFPGLPAPLQGPANALAGITDPYLNLFRGIIPPIGGTIDLSPILAFVTLNVFTNAAAALPAEMPKDGAAPADAKGPGRP